MRYNITCVCMENCNIEEAYSNSMNNKDKRQVKKLIFEYFEHIEEEWNNFQKERNR